MVGLVNNKDFYVDTHFLCGIKSAENIFDLPDNIFECTDFICFDDAIRKFISDKSVTMHLWPWQWHTSALTDEVYIYETLNDRIIYFRSDMKEYYDAKLVRKEQSLQGCEIFDFDFHFPEMIRRI